ncbi:hypothetical protein SeMB42_g06161, partial [Synchytrium endobioticum]
MSVAMTCKHTSCCRGRVDDAYYLTIAKQTQSCWVSTHVTSANQVRRFRIMKLNMMKKVIAIVVLQATILYYLVSAGGCCSGGDANEGVAAVTEHDPYNVDVEANTGHVFDAPSYGYQESVVCILPTPERVATKPE